MFFYLLVSASYVIRCCSNSSTSFLLLHPCPASSIFLFSISPSPCGASRGCGHGCYYYESILPSSPGAHKRRCGRVQYSGVVGKQGDTATTGHCSPGTGRLGFLGTGRWMVREINRVGGEEGGVASIGRNSNRESRRAREGERRQEAKRAKWTEGICRVHSGRGQIYDCDVGRGGGTQKRRKRRSNRDARKPGSRKGKPGRRQETTRHWATGRLALLAVETDLGGPHSSFLGSSSSTLCSPSLFSLWRRILRRFYRIFV